MAHPPEFRPPSPAAGDSLDLMALGTARIHVEAKNYGEAIAACERALAGHPTSRETVTILRWLAAALDGKGAFQEAIDRVATLLDTDPMLELEADPVELAHARVVVSKCHLELGDLTASRLQAERAVALLETSNHTRLPEWGFAENLLGHVALRSGDIQQAQVHYRKALECFQNAGDVARLGLAYLNLGNVYKQRCDWERALEHFHAAYYLRRNEGAYQDQAGILLNIGQVQMKLGRLEEAREHVERALRRAIELNDQVRQVRAYLTLAQWHRESGEYEAASQDLAEARTLWARTDLGREGCHLLLEEAELARDLGMNETARARLAEASDRIDRIAPRGDLKIDALLLEADLDMAEARWDTARDALDSALRLAREDGNRYQEGLALRLEMRLLAATGHLSEAERVHATLEERHRRGDERPALAGVAEVRAGIEQTIRGDAEAALRFNVRARDLWRRLLLPRRAAAVELRMVENLISLGQRAAARNALEMAREQLVELGAPVRVLSRVELLERRISREDDGAAASAPDGLIALRRLQEIEGWDISPIERMRSCLRVVAEALEADGAWLGRNGAEGIELVGTQSMARLGGRRLLPTDELVGLGIGSAEAGAVPPGGTPPGAGLGGLDLTRASFVSGTRAVTEADGAPHSAMLLPIRAHGRDHLIYLERRSRARAGFGRGEMNFALVLTEEVARILPTTPIEPTQTEDEALERLRHGIYVADVITEDPRMLEILSLIHKVSDSDLTVLLQGETGTGKKLLAQAIHRISGRRSRALVTVDCASLPDSVLESELFGHKKGAFTGAMQDRIGLLEEADGGTVFLDEIDKAGLTVQRRFLHLLDSAEIRPVGATTYRTLDVRVVCATSCPDLRVMVEEGRFLKDLYYRLNDISIVVPALRDRPQDVELLARCFIEKFAGSLPREIRGISPAYMERIKAHSWPGNVRELEKAIRRSVTLCENGGYLTPTLLPAQVLEGSAAPPASATLRGRVEAFEAQLLLETLEKVRWNKSRAAVELGLSRKGLKAKIERYRLDRRRRRG
ncbi:MAG: sigma 54-interacting transcriptional regulator [Candidatus Eisenbacteria bacterium]|nr:sigma 54-interacting transcriptional regulator [Candidatus Eisenbacteria bacterium]